MPENGAPIHPDDHQAQQAAKREKTLRRRQAASRRQPGFLKGFLGGVCGAVVVLLCVGVLWQCTPVLNGLKPDGSTGSQGLITINTSDEASVAEAVATKCLDSTVTVCVYASGATDWSQYFGSGSSSSGNAPSALGSGVVYQSDSSVSYILTNSHVVEGADRCTVKHGDATFDATVVGSDPSTDIAVLSIPVGGLTPMDIGDSSDLAVGEWVMAIGTPYGYDQTCTTGIVSALYRSDTLSSSSVLGYTTYTDMIQTDAAINPGNSGGALVNSEGALVGINTYISSRSQSSAGLGFAIPTSNAIPIADRLIEDGSVDHAYMGITIADNDDPEGVLVTSVSEGTGAAAAGLQEGDVIIKIGGEDARNNAELTSVLLRHTAGETVTVTYIRDGRTQECRLTLGSISDIPAANGAASQNGSGEQNEGGSGMPGLDELFNFFFGN